MNLQQKFVALSTIAFSVSACEFSASPLAGESGTGSLSDPAPVLKKCTAEEEENFVSEMTRILESDESPYPFSLRLERQDEAQFSFNKGGSTMDTVYESASSSKLVTSLVILRLVDKGVLKLSDRPQDFIAEWPISSADPLYNTTLADLLSFTSGFYEEPACINLPTSTIAACAINVANLNSGKGRVPGAEFYYSGSHMQIAGLMAIRAFGKTNWSEVFEDFQVGTGLFPSATFDLPSVTNPRLAGGMHWTGSEYFEFLRDLRNGRILSANLMREFLVDRTDRSKVTIVNSPAQKGLGEDWHYGLGFWHECIASDFNCEPGSRISSPGAYGAYPFWDRKTNHLGFLSMQGQLGGFREGARIERLIQEIALDWAACGL